MQDYVMSGNARAHTNRHTHTVCKVNCRNHWRRKRLSASSSNGCRLRRLPLTTSFALRVSEEANKQRGGGGGREVNSG